MVDGKLRKQHSEEELRSYFVLSGKLWMAMPLKKMRTQRGFLEKDNKFSFKSPKLEVSLRWTGTGVLTGKRGQSCTSTFVLPPPYSTHVL